MRQSLKRSLTEADLRRLLREAIDLQTSGSYAKANGYTVPSGTDEWVIERIKWLRRCGQTKLAHHYIQYELQSLEAMDWSNGTKRANAFREALGV